MDLVTALVSRGRSQNTEAQPSEVREQFPLTRLKYYETLH